MGASRFQLIVRNQVLNPMIMNEKKSIPVTVLSGFLGAGKTTLLNHWLKQAANAAKPLKLAVIVNDLGAVNIDTSLIKQSARDLKSPIGGLVELTSGCICCSIQGELLEALDAIVEQANPDHIMIEATGGMFDGGKLRERCSGIKVGTCQ